MSLDEFNLFDPESEPEPTDDEPTLVGNRRSLELDADENGPAALDDTIPSPAAPAGPLDDDIVPEPDLSDLAALNRSVIGEDAAPDAEVPADDAEDESAPPAEVPAPTSEPAPDSAAPPRIVAETPVGGRRPAVFSAPDAEPEPDAAPESRPAAPPRAPSPPTATSEPTQRLVPPPPPFPRAERVPPIGAEDTPAARPLAGPPAESEAPTAPVTPPALEDTPPAAPSEWDEDISPELAAILFAAGSDDDGDREATTPTRTVDGTPLPGAPAPPPAPAPAIELTDVGQARTLPITAGEINSPPPGESPAGRARYQRLEEPYKGDKGQRTVETWDYLGPERPALDERSIKRIRIEEITFADGSWLWKYERRYTDRGYDRRTVRASTDQRYIERDDELKQRDPAAGKTLRRKERAALILAGPEEADKRGFFSRLLGREDDTPDANVSWREATPQEVRHARRHGGDAL